MTVVWFSSACGGSGTTTVAALCALTSATSDATVLVDLTGGAAILVGLGAHGVTVPADHVVTVTSGLTFIDATVTPATAPDVLVDTLAATGATVIVDAGRNNQPSATTGGVVRHYRVLHPNDVAVWHAFEVDLVRDAALHDVCRVDGLVVVGEARRGVVDRRDIATVLGAPVVATIGYRARLARVVDRDGLLTYRPPARLRRTLHTILDHALAPVVAPIGGGS